MYEIDQEALDYLYDEMLCNYDDDEQDEVVILKVIREGDEETYSGVEDEDVLNAVFEIFQEQNAEEDED